MIPADDPLRSVAERPNLREVEPLDGIRGDEFLGYLARVNFFRDGYGSSTADIWAQDGRLLAKSYQTFVIYA